MNKPDAELVKLALKQDRYAFRQIVERTQNMTYQVAYRFLRTSHEAEDAVQEVYVRVWKNLYTYLPSVKLSTWIYKITVNYCLDVLKSKAFRESVRAEPLEQVQLTGSRLADYELNDIETHEILMRAAVKLTPVQQTVFILRNLEGLSSEEVCKTLNMTADNVKSNLYHARKRMAEMLRPLKNLLR